MSLRTPNLFVWVGQLGYETGSWPGLRVFGDLGFVC